MKTRTLTVTDVSPVALIPSIPCNNIRALESRQASGWPRAWFFSQPGSTDAADHLAEGTEKAFTPGGSNVYQTTQTVAWLQLESGGGSTTFLIQEEMV